MASKRSCEPFNKSKLVFSIYNNHWLRVMILNDDGSWFAQGLDIDYAAQGTSVDDVKSLFEDGLMATADEHIKAYGWVKNLQKAPRDQWELAVCIFLNGYSQVSVRCPNLGSPSMASHILRDATTGFAGE